MDGMRTKSARVMQQFTSTARKDGTWRVIQCDQFPGALSHVDTLDGAEAVHAEAIELDAGTPHETITVTIRVIP
jgi:hypothetical protein